MREGRLAEVEPRSEVADADWRLRLPQRGHHRQPGWIRQRLHEARGLLGPTLVHIGEPAANAALPDNWQDFCQAARRLLRAPRCGRELGRADLEPHEGAGGSNPADDDGLAVEGEDANLHLRLHCGARPQPADPLSPHEQAQGCWARRVGEAWALDLLSARVNARAGDSTAAEPPDRLGCWARDQFLDQTFDAHVDLVPYAAYGVHVLPGGVIELPVFIALAWIDRAGVAAAHRYYDVGGAHEVIRQGLRKLPADVQTDLAHRLDHMRIQRARRRAAGRADVHATRRVPLEKRRRHLASTGVVHTNEEDLGDLGLHRRQAYL